MPSSSIRRQAWVVLASYLTRPMMWLAWSLYCVLLVVLSATSGPSDEGVDREVAFPTPFDRSERPIRHGDRNWRWVEGPEVRTEVRAAKLEVAYGKLTVHILQPEGLAAELWPSAATKNLQERYPNLETISFAAGVFDRLPAESLAGLRSLRAVSVIESTIDAEDVQKLAAVASLEWLLLQTDELDASLGPLAALTRLTWLALIEKDLAEAAGVAESRNPFRRQVLRELAGLPAIEQLVLLPWQSAAACDAAGAGHPACDEVLKRNAAELFADSSSLRRLWIGRGGSSEEVSRLNDLSRSLPRVDVRPAAYDSERLFTALLAVLFLTVILMTMAGQLTTQFSGPPSLLTPRFASRHLAVFAALAVMMTVPVVFALTLHGIPPLPSAAAVTCGLALALVVRTPLETSGEARPRWTSRLLDVAIAMLPMGMIYATIFTPPWLAGATDRLLTGFHPVAAGLLLALGGVGAARSLFAYRFLLRVLVERGDMPGKSDRGEAARRWGWRPTPASFWSDRVIGAWRRRLQRAAAGASGGSVRAVGRMWRLGRQRDFKWGSMVNELASLISILAFVYLLGGIPEFPWQLGLVVAVLFCGPALLAHEIMGRPSRRPMLQAELLRPASRLVWVRAIFTDTLASMAAKMATTSLAAIALGWLFVGTPPTEAVAYTAAAAVAYTLAAAGIAMVATLSWGYGESLLLAFLFAAESLVMCGALFAACGLVEEQSPIGNELAYELFTHPAGMLFLWSLGLITPLVAYFRWLEVEFATQGEAGG